MEHKIDRAAINRANAQHSTGPKTAEGKQRSSRNACKHSLYARDIVLEHEELEEYENLRNNLIAEHHPTTTTELFLVDEMVQNAWRIRRIRPLYANALRPTLAVNLTRAGLVAAYARALASAERQFHRSLTTLTKLQRERKSDTPDQAKKNGFVSQNQKENTAEPLARQTPAPRPAPSATQPAGFVSQNNRTPAPAPSVSEPEHYIVSNAAAPAVTQSLSEHAVKSQLSAPSKPSMKA